MRCIHSKCAGLILWTHAAFHDRLPTIIRNGSPKDISRRFCYRSRKIQSSFCFSPTLTEMRRASVGVVVQTAAHSFLLRRNCCTSVAARSLDLCNAHRWIQAGSCSLCPWVLLLILQTIAFVVDLFGTTSRHYLGRVGLKNPQFSKLGPRSSVETDI